MFHPVFKLVLGRPDLIAEHLVNYGALVQQEASETGRGIAAKVIAGLVALVSATLALGLTGVAIMLGALHGSFHWVLVAVPGVALLVAAICAWVAVRPVANNGFADVRAQVEADIRALRAAGGHDADH